MTMGNHDQTGSCRALSVLESILSSSDYYSRAYYRSLLAKCSISLAGPTMVARYLAGRVAVAN